MKSERDEDDDKVDRRLRAQIWWGVAFLYAGFIAFLCYWLNGG